MIGEYRPWKARLRIFLGMVSEYGAIPKSGISLALINRKHLFRCKPMYDICYANIT